MAHLFALLLPILILSAPPPGNQQSGPVYFPTTVGARWVYRTPDGDGTMVVSAVDD